MGNGESASWCSNAVELVANSATGEKPLASALASIATSVFFANAGVARNS
jgi:hypothetical protein